MGDWCGKCKGPKATNQASHGTVKALAGQVLGIAEMYGEEGGGDLGSALAEESAAESWVTKSNMSAYSRCPYAFSLLDSGQISKEDAYSAFTTSLMETGIAFEAKVVEEQAEGWDMPPGGFPELFAQDDLMLFGLPEFQNAGLHTKGIPDAIETAGGAIFPVEVKSHKKVTPLDRAELAFYWDLMEPYRTKEVEPEGIMILRSGEGSVTQRVTLTKKDFDEAHKLVDSVRSARAEGVLPRVCDCDVCAQRKEEILASTRERKDLSMIFGISGAYIDTLSSVGCQDYDQLAAIDPASVVPAFKARKQNSVNQAAVERWQAHAQAYAQDHPVLLPGATALPDLKNCITLDLEWDTTGEIYQIGISLFKDGDATFQGWWADNASEEKAGLEGLHAFLAKHPDLPVVTWNGKGADLPRLRDRAGALGTTGFDEGLLDDRHLDLYDWAKNSVRFPTPGLGLKEVRRALGSTKKLDVSGGDDALAIFWKYKETKDPALREQLIAYNREDTTALRFIEFHLAKMADPAEKVAA